MPFRLTMSIMEPVIGTQAILPRWSVASLGSKSLMIQACIVDPRPVEIPVEDIPCLVTEPLSSPALSTVEPRNSTRAPGVILVLCYGQRVQEWTPRSANSESVHKSRALVNSSTSAPSSITPLLPPQHLIQFRPTSCYQPSVRHIFATYTSAASAPISEPGLRRSSLRSISPPLKRRREQDDVDGWKDNEHLPMWLCISWVKKLRRKL